MRRLVSILFIFLANVIPIRAADDAAPGTASGSLTYHGETVNFTAAVAFIDRDDDKKPTILVISDQKLPLEKWNSEFDMMRDETKWSGLVFFLNRDGTFYRSDIHLKGRQASVSGFFGMQWSDPTGKNLSGTAQTDPSTKETKLSVTFNSPRP